MTLSVYSPRDWWYFRHPDAMLRATDFEVPLNPGNVFVRRGQALSALLDAAARVCRRAGRDLPPARRENLTDLFALVKDDPATLPLLRAVVGEILAELRCTDLAAFWSKATANARPGIFKNWRELLPWEPRLLFDDINLPLLRVSWPPAWAGDRGQKDEDIGLVIGECAPGNDTRRYDPARVLWLPPPDPAPPGEIGAAPPLGPEGYEGCLAEELFDDDQLAAVGHDEQEIHRLIMADLASEVAARLPAGEIVHHQLFRPASV